MDISTIKGIIKECIKLIYICPQYRAIIKSLRDKTGSRVVLFGTPAHGNLGDQAIAISELDFLNSISNGRDVIEIPMPLFKTHQKLLRDCIRSDDTIIISGGGWMGNLWIHNEFTIREIVTDYLKNRVIIFPQTLYYTDDEEGRETAKKSKEIFVGHNNLILTVRDAQSFEYAKNNLGFTENTNLFFCPDMVVYGTLANVENNLSDRKKALLCLRRDIEKISDTESVKKILEDAGYAIKETTTVLKKLIPMNKREEIVKNKIKEFGDASLVVTDRLHAMLFSLLAGTPCLAHDNATGKVFGVGKYLKSNGMPVCLIDKLEISLIEDIDTNKRTFYLTDELNGYFRQLGEMVNLKEI